VVISTYFHGIKLDSRKVPFEASLDVSDTF